MLDSEVRFEQFYLFEKVVVHVVLYFFLWVLMKNKEKIYFFFFLFTFKIQLQGLPGGSVVRIHL